MSIMNKLAVTALPVECTLVGIQMFFTVLCVIPKFTTPGAVELGEWVDAKYFAPIPFFLFSGMLLSSMFAYSYNTVATIVVFRNLGPLFALASGKSPLQCGATLPK
jgi:hypothetical protein